MRGEKAIHSAHEDSAMIAPLRQFFLTRGHVNVPNFKEYSELYDLCTKLRASRSRLLPNICKELDGMGFLWQLQLSNELRWYYHYGELREFQKQFGHTRVPPRRKPYKTLGTWVLRQRRDEKILPLQSKRLLTRIGFEWSGDIKKKKEAEWRAMFRKLIAFHRIKGHADVPDRYKPDEKLGRWVSTVRYSEKRLEPWKTKLLKTVGFKFSGDIQQQKENNRKKLFGKIRQYFIKHGHANVPETYKDSKLAIAVAYLRQYPERMSESERKQLKTWKFLFSEDIKQQWQDLWESSFEKLQKFKKKFGHCRVSSAFTDQPLARWVANQRKDEHEGKLPASRKKRLIAIGFSFYKDIEALQEKKWLAMYGKLMKFKKSFGHTIVKEGFKDSKLAYWVQHQRQARTKMSRQRKRLLNEIGFVWRLK